MLLHALRLPPQKDGCPAEQLMLRQEHMAENLIHDDNVRLSYLGGTVANREAQL